MTALATRWSLAVILTDIAGQVGHPILPSLTAV
jgi:hypothetical protein